MSWRSTARRCGGRSAPGQVRAEARSNEIAALPALLDMLTLEDRLVTADAMHTQRTMAATVTARGGARPRVVRDHRYGYRYLLGLRAARADMAAMTAHSEAIGAAAGPGRAVARKPRPRAACQYRVPGTVAL